MHKLVEVDEAKALMREAVDWSVMKWLTEKKRVRKAADRANEALDKMQKQVRQTWDPALQAAYGELNGQPAANGEISPELRALAKRIKQTDDEAYRARMTAEDTFDEAERKLSTRLAREGTQQAIHSWEMYEKAIKKAEAAVSSPQTAG
jgi:hypothetical protein